MARITSAIASTHNPRIFWNRDQADPTDHARLMQTFETVRAMLAEDRPDIVVVLANDHLDGFFFDNMPAFSIVTAPIAEGPYWYETEIMKLPAYRGPVAQDQARHLLRAGREAGVYFAELQNFRIDHAFTLPLALLRPEQDVPVVPIVTNAFGYPLASTGQWYALGQFLARSIAAWPSELRVSVIASLNLVVEVGGPKVGKYDMEFTRWMVEQMRTGNRDAMLDTLSVEKLISKGNSTAEFLNFIALLGIVEARAPDFIEHRPVKGVGMCPLAFWNLA